MSQHSPPQQPPPYVPRSWSPHQPGAGSPHPHPGSYEPPNKRARLSPNPQSPYGSPGLANISLPNQLFSRPFQGAQHNGYPPGMNNYHNTLNQVHPPPRSPPRPPPPTVGAMGPPSRPSDKPTDMNELSDVLLGSGVDLREEEAALIHRNHAQQQYDSSFGSQLSTSFNSAISGSPPSLYAAPRIDYNHYSHNFPGDRSSFFGAGVFNQPAVPFEPPEERARKEREKAERRKAETKQYYLNNPFLYTGPLQRHIEKQIRTHQLNSNIVGHYKPAGDKKPTKILVAGPDKHERLEVLVDQHLITNDSPWAEILSLLSLAAGERIRGLIEDAAAIAKSRRIGSHGIVPADLQDLAAENGKVETVPVLPTPSQSTVSPGSNPLKRSYSEMNAPRTPPSDDQKSPATTIAYPNALIQALQKSAQAERAAEEERLAKRRKRAAAASESSTSGTVPPDPFATGAGQRAPEPDPKKPGTKKEQRKKDEAKATEAQQHAATNKTMNMALGLGGALGGRKLAWMSGGSGGSSSFSRPSPLNQTTKVSSKNATPAGSSLAAGRKWGEFREDKETGAGIQLRDLLSVLENDGKDRRALIKAQARMSGRRY